jgi:hypothetical protein
MSHRIDRLRRTAVALSLATAAVLLPGLTGPGAGAAGLPEFRLAQAQPPAGQRPAPPPRQAKPAQPPGNPVEGQIADLKKQLGITAAQQPQFDGFAQAIRQNAQAMDALMQQEPPN